VPEIVIYHVAAEDSDNTGHCVGTPTAWPIGEPMGSLQRLTLVQAAAPAEDGARRTEQARGPLCHRVAFMEPQQCLRTVQLARGMSGMGHLNQVVIFYRREAQGHRFFSMLLL
jgi:hypothetical protein